MNLLVVCIICGFLPLSSQNPTRYWTLLPNVLVVEVDGSLCHQPLICLQSEEVMKRDHKEQDMVWKKDGVEEAQRGNIYLVELEETSGGGNYTCHSKDGSLLNYTVVLIQEDETKRKKILLKTNQEEYLKCSAQNYSGFFHCSWTWHHNRIGRIEFVRVQRISDDSDTRCFVDGDGQRWMCSSGQRAFTCLVDRSGHGISCLDEQHCPYTEEIHVIHITVYVRTKYYLVESYSKAFYLSEIVKPDKVMISKVNKTMIKWSYPSSWDKPYSYFPLVFEVAQLKRNCKRCQNPCNDVKAMKINCRDICQLEVKQRSKLVCIRAKDALWASEWSEWTHLRLMTPD